MAWQDQTFKNLVPLTKGQFLRGANPILLARVDQGNDYDYVWIDIQAGTCFRRNIFERSREGRDPGFVALAATGESLHFQDSALCHMVFAQGINDSPKEKHAQLLSMRGCPAYIRKILPQPAAANRVLVEGYTRSYEMGLGGNLSHFSHVWLVNLYANEAEKLVHLSAGPSQGHDRALWHPLHPDIFFTFDEKNICAWQVSQSNIPRSTVLWETSQEDEVLCEVKIDPREPDSVVCTTATPVPDPRDPDDETYHVRMEKILFSWIS